MKLTLFLVLQILVQVTGYGQIVTVPCEFTWLSAKTNNSNINISFVTEARGQPYQGPCLAFAFIAAIESKYFIENNSSVPAMKLSDAYLDYGIPSANEGYISALEGGFRIPLSSRGCCV